MTINKRASVKEKQKKITNNSTAALHKTTSKVGDNSIP
jgi:hypothetical protein